MPKKVVCQRVEEIDIEDLKNGDLFTTMDLEGNKKSYIQVNGKSLEVLLEKDTYPNVPYEERIIAVFSSKSGMAFKATPEAFSKKEVEEEVDW